MARYSCADCRTELERDQTSCHICRSESRSIETSDTAELHVHAGFRGKARRGEPGEVRPHSEQRNEVVWRHDRQRWERCIMTNDRDNDHYVEEWRDLETGEVAFRKEGPLSDPAMHGESGKRGKRSAETPPPEEPT